MEEQTEPNITPLLPGGRSISKLHSVKSASSGGRLIHNNSYEDITCNILKHPFVCERKQSMSCPDAGDLEYDSTRIWVVDKPGLPKTPRGFKRSLVLRKTYSKMDDYYITPTGKKLRTRKDVAAFIDANQKFNYVPLGDFNFTVPKVMQDTVSERTAKRTRNE